MKDASTTANQASFLVVAVGHDYAYLQTSTPASRNCVVASSTSNSCE